MNTYPTLRNFENPMVTGLGAALDARDSAGAAVRAARKCLLEMFCESAPTPTAIVPTPGFGKSRFTVGEVIADSFAGRDGDAILNELLRIVARAAEGQDMRERANQWIRAQANRYADFHAADLAEQEGDD